MDEVLLGDIIGSPFVNKGRDVLNGLDCWGLVMEVFRRYGIELPDFTIDHFAYAKIDELAENTIETHKWEVMHHVTDKDVPLVVLMRVHPKYITHAGVYVGKGKIIHTMEKTGGVISKASTLRNQIIGYYRFAEDK